MFPFNLFRKGVDKVSKTVILGIIRHVLTSLGGAMVAAGFIKASEMDGVVGAGVILIGALWSILEKVTRHSPES